MNNIKLKRNILFYLGYLFLLTHCLLSNVIILSTILQYFYYLSIMFLFAYMIISFMQSSKKNLKNKIKNYEYQKKFYKEANKYDVVILSSKFETFERLTIDYMTNKLTKNTIFLYKPCNYQNLTNVIKKIYYDDEKDKTINRSYNLVKDNFTGICIARNIYNLYLKILRIERNCNI